MRRRSSRRSPFGHQLVQLGQGGDPWHGHHVTASEPADLAFDPALLVRSVLAGPAVEGLEEVVTAQGHEALGLGATAPHQHPGDSRLQVVVADTCRRAAEVLEGADRARR